MRYSKEERAVRRYFINDAVRRAIADEPSSFDWIFRSRGEFDIYCRGAGICPDSVRKETRRLIAERDAKLERFQFEG